MSTLAINAGSSSVKFGLYDDRNCERLLSGDIDWAGGNRERAQLTLLPRKGAPVCREVPVPDDATAAARVIEAVAGSGVPGMEGRPTITAVGHRVVHGGAEFRNSVLINLRVKSVITRLSDLAPLHNPPALKAIDAVERALPGKPQVAVFDTAFFAHLPPKAYLYPVPYEWHEKWGIRRFGFHGTSHAYCAARAAEMMQHDLKSLRLITCHLGGGCSATAVRGGVAAGMTMGFTPMEGLMMGTRCGSIDPGILMYLQAQKGLTHKELHHALNHCAGLKGVSGVSSDLAQIEAAAAAGNDRARLAFEMFADRVRSAIGSLATTLGGVDAIAFTDRIGEGSPALRAAVCQNLEFMGVKLDPERNATTRGDVDVTTNGSRVRVLVIHTEEELMVARETRRVVQGMCNS